MNFFRSPSSLWRSLKFRFLKRFASPKALANFLYEISFGKKINWKNPEDLNQWINWLSFNTNTSLWSTLADKYKVRNYIIGKGYRHTLIPLLEVWKKPEEISFDNLPNSFVLKMNNGSADVRIVKDKNEEDIEEIREYFQNMFHRKFGKNSAEPHYLKISPVIIAEQMLAVDDQDLPSTSLIDYKFWCFNGKVVCCFVCSNRTKENFVIDLYSVEDWKRIDVNNLKFDTTHLKASEYMPRPSNLNKMVKMASELSEGLPQIRIDMYQVGGKIYFGEMTLTSLCGRMNYFTDSYLIELGAYCKKAVEELGLRDTKTLFHKL